MFNNLFLITFFVFQPLFSLFSTPLLSLFLLQFCLSISNVLRILPTQGQGVFSSWQQLNQLEDGNTYTMSHLIHSKCKEHINPRWSQLLLSLLTLEIVILSIWTVINFYVTKNPCRVPFIPIWLWNSGLNKFNEAQNRTIFSSWCAGSFLLYYSVKLDHKATSTKRLGVHYGFTASMGDFPLLCTESSWFLWRTTCLPQCSWKLVLDHNPIKPPCIFFIHQGRNWALLHICTVKCVHTSVNCPAQPAQLYTTAEQSLGIRRLEQQTLDGGCLGKTKAFFI